MYFKREEEKRGVAPSHAPRLGVGLCPDWESNQRPCSSQASAQPTEPHQLELVAWF